MLIYKKMGIIESLKRSMGMTQAQSEGQQGGRTRRRRRGRKCRGGNPENAAADEMQGGRRRRGRKSRRGSRKHTRRHRR